jgi:hypothetical protein
LSISIKNFSKDKKIPSYQFKSFYFLFTKAGIGEIFVGQGFSLAFKIPLFVSPFGKGGLEGDFFNFFSSPDVTLWRPRGIYCSCKVYFAIILFIIAAKR